VQEHVTADQTARSNRPASLTVVVGPFAVGRLPAPRRWPLAVLALILVAALGLRMLWSHNGLPYLHHWDEPRIANNALRMLQTGDFNPHFFHYGSLLIYLDLGVDVVHYLHLAGKPEGHPDALGSLRDLRVGAPGGWEWQVSHPSFYLWNRWLTSAFGAGCALVAFLLARALGEQRAALVAAFVVATVPFHVEQSARVTTDVPSAFFALSAAWLSVEFLRRNAPGLLVAALACVGAATSLKYNAAVALAVPLAALAYAQARSAPAYRWWLWPSVALVPVVFVLGTPYALFDLPSFLEDAGYEVRHYLVRGHGEFTVEPGLAHLGVQLAEILRHLGWGICIVAAVGILTVRGRPLAVIAFLLPVLQLWMTSRTTVAFHRNVVLVYPFLAVAFGLGATWLVDGLFSRVEGGRLRRAFQTAVVAAAALFVVHRSAAAFEQSWRIGTTVETRSAAISRLNGLARDADGPAKAVISSELRVHPHDLRRLRLPYEERPLLEIACRPEERSVVLVPGRVSAGGERLEQARHLNLLLEAGGEILATVGRERPLSLEENTRNPGVQIRRQWKTSELKPDVTPQCALADLPAAPALVRAAAPARKRTARSGQNTTRSGK
jgi:hypothetical protein